MLKKSIVLLFSVTCFLQGYAQKLFFEKSLPGMKHEKTISDVSTPSDTLGKNAFLAGTPTQYYAQGGGYVAGSNFYNDKAKAQQYNITSSIIVEEVILWFGAKNYSSANPASSLTVNLYRLDSLGINTSGQKIASAPGSVIDSATLLIADINTNGYISVPFPSHPIPYLNFAAGIDLTTLAVGDSVGLWTNTDGNAGATEHSWEKWSDNNWHTMLQAWPLDIDFAIWPVVDTSSAGINNNNFFEGIKLSQNQPNPASYETIVQYELQNSANVTFEMYDVTGKKVLSLNEGLQNQGKHNINLTTEKLASGTYYYSLKADDHRITKKMVITK